MIRHSAVLAVAGLLAASASALAEEEPDAIPGGFSANVAFSSDYVFRGISQTMSDPAVQGGLEWSHASGIHAGVWGSNVDFGTDAQTEVDWVAGFANEVHGINYDVSVIYYSYPGASSALDYDYWEAALAVGYEVNETLSLGVGYNYSPEFFGGTGHAHYVSGNVGVTVPGAPLGLTVSASVGRQYVEDNAIWGTPDYTNWSIGAGVNVEGFDLAVTYTDTDLDAAECFGSNLCEGRAVLSVSRAF